MNPQVLAYLPLVSPVATLVVVVLAFSSVTVTLMFGLAIFRSYIDAGFEAESRVNEANFKVLLSKIEDLDIRLTRLEVRFHR